jgi:uncharacterized protein YggE
VEEVESPTYSLSDDRPARRAARAEALEQANADAEAYAAGLGLRVARVVRVTERIGLESLSLLSDASERVRLAMRSPVAAGASEGREPEIRTSVVVGVDFALAPQ